MDEIAVPEGHDFIKLVNEIERRIVPSQCQYLHFNFWPLMRFMLNANRKLRPRIQRKPIAQISGERMIELLKKAFNNTATGKAHLQDLEARAEERFLPDLLGHLPQSDALFLTRGGQYRCIGGQCVEPLTDGIRHLTSDLGTQTTIVDQDPRQEGEEFFSETLILPVEARKVLVNLHKPSCLIEWVSRQKILRKVRHVNRIIPDKYAILRIDEDAFLRRVASSSQRLLFWDAVLRQVKPKAIFLISYSGAPYICTAGRHQGIPVIDIQHGGMHRHHPLAANWVRPPKNGYDLLPNSFWCWDKRSCNYVYTTPIKSSEGLVGGNPKTVLEHHLFGGEEPSFSKGKPRVLVALQYGADQMVEPHVIKAYLATKNQVDWRFRLHPMGWSFLEEVVATFGVTKESVEQESRIPLHKALSEVNLVLCNASTLLHEAADLDIPCAVWSNKGANIFEDLVIQKRVIVATEFDTLSEVVLNTVSASGTGQPRSSMQDRNQVNSDRIRDTYQSLLHCQRQ